jgi:hypothetical protein
MELIKKVARRLGALRQKVVFLGGSATGFHITDEAAPEVRTTKDVAIIVEVTSRVEFHQLEKTLRDLGFSQKMVTAVSKPDLIEFIASVFQKWMSDERFLEALPDHLMPDQASQKRRKIILERIQIISEIGNK